MVRRMLEKKVLFHSIRFFNGRYELFFVDKLSDLSLVGFNLAGLRIHMQVVDCIDLPMCFSFPFSAHFKSQIRNFQPYLFSFQYKMAIW